ncbi:protein KRI1 homolog [Mercenaria mercenaria]|uniref:protein KRI1 homolog n=1 Tax=Mercenaria mercenaria TaxID=6596 RepID=UPI00234F4C31|nr:protein KRI1 homolog [Mercenaria mercenaria]
MSDGFKINKAYAEKYNTWRQKEELQKLKDKYGDEEESEDSSSSESEDEDAEALTEQLERDWLRTLSALKSKDPRIYQKDVKFYHDDKDESGDNKKSKKTKDKPMFLKDYERKVLLEKGGLIGDDDNSDGEEPSTSYTSRLGYHQEQEQLRKSVVAAAGSDSGDSDDDGLLKRREKSKEEKQREETDYLEWLKGQKDTLETENEVGVELEPLKDYWQNKNLDAGEKFLKNYILNRQYIDKDEESMPTYDEIVNEEDEDFSEDEELLTKQDTFERKYNFRFEEPDAAEIKTFPRSFEDTVRRKDTKRSDKRKEVEERKKKDKEKKKEELKQLKKLKRQEIMDKIEKLKQITGNKTLGIDEKDLEEDFDPSKYDQMMQQCFDDDYYEEGDGEDIKPVFEMSDEEIENWDNWTGEGDNWTGEEDNWTEGDNYDGNEDEDYWNEASAEDPDFIMDADYDPVADMERKKNKKEKKRKNKLAQALNTKKPVFDPNEKTFEEYFDEYYKLDYEDIIDDMPCRFKYRKVTPNSYGLTVDEILKCRDKELNAWASVKKMSQYRTEEEEDHDIRAYSAKGKNLKKKQNVLTSLFESEEKDDKEENIGEKPQTQKESKSKKRRNKRKALKKRLAENVDSQDSGIASQNEVGEEKNKGQNSQKNDGKETNKRNSETDVEDLTNKVKQNQKKNKKETDVKEGETDSSEVRNEVKVIGKTEANDHDVSKHHKKRKIEETFGGDQEVDAATEGSSKKKKKKNKMEVNVRTGNSNSDSDKGNTEEKTDISETKGERLNQSKSVDSADKSEKRKKKKKNKKKNKDGQKLKLSEERLKAYGINPKKYKYMKKEELFQIKPRKNTKQFS